jgi:large subunit ribosomal protein L5
MVDFKPMLEQYKEDVVPALMKEFGYTSVMQVPRLANVAWTAHVGLPRPPDPCGLAAHA